MDNDVSVDSSWISGKSSVAVNLVKVKVRILESKAISWSSGIRAADGVDWERSVVLRIIDLSDGGPNVGVCSVKSSWDHNVGEGHEGPGCDGSVSGVTEVNNDSHSGVLILEGDFEDWERVEGLGAWGLESTEGESIAEDVDDLEFVESEVLVVVLVSSIVVSVERVEMNGASC